MVEMNILEAVRSALDVEMDRNDNVMLLGEDIGPNGGVFRATQGLSEKYGDTRVLDTPLNESGIIGFGVGMALYGLKPIAEIQFSDFIFPSMDQIVSEVSKFRYRSGGEFTSSMVIRTPYGGGVRGSHYHSQSPEAFFTQLPGLKVVIPSNPYDAKGLLISAIRSSDPVLFMEPKRIYRAFKEEVPEDEYTVPLDEGLIVRSGSDITIASYGAMLHIALDAAELATSEGIDVEVLDLRTVNPVDKELIGQSVRKTGRFISVTESPKTSGFGAELSAIVAENWIEYIEAPIKRITGYDTPYPFILEKYYLPTPERVLAAIREVFNY